MNVSLLYRSMREKPAESELMIKTSVFTEPRRFKMLHKNSSIAGAHRELTCTHNTFLPPFDRKIDLLY